jgi:hypothetical protein
MSEPTITTLAVSVAELRRDFKTAFTQIEKNSSTAESVHDLVTEVKLQGQALSTLVQKFTDLSNDIKEVKAKPAKRWDNLVTQIIALVVALVFGLIMAKIGIS